MERLKMIKSKLHAIAAEYGYELVELTGLKLGGRSVVRAYIHKPGGVTITDCQVLSRAYSDYLDTEDPIEGRYTLEVSSLGLDRPLKEPADFQRRVGEIIQLELQPGTYSKSLVEGKLTAMDENDVIISNGNRELHFDINCIIRGKVII
jgi:ribosome maturation factor RimP